MFLAIILIAALIGVTFVVSLLQVWRRTLPRSAASRALPTLVGVVAPALLIGSLLGVLVGLIKAFSAVNGESIDPSQKARILGEGISDAINCAAFGFLVCCVATAVHVLSKRGDRSLTGEGTSRPDGGDGPEA